MPVQLGVTPRHNECTPPSELQVSLTYAHSEHFRIDIAKSYSHNKFNARLNELTCQNVEQQRIRKLVTECAQMHDIFGSKKLAISETRMYRMPKDAVVQSNDNFHFGLR